MKIITLEEHFQLAEIKEAVSKMLPSFSGTVVRDLRWQRFVQNSQSAS